MDGIRAGINKIGKGLVALFCFFCGLVMFLVAPDLNSPLFACALGLLGIFAGIFFISEGRPRIISLSLLSVSILFMGIGYIVYGLIVGSFISGSRSAPSVLNAILFLIVYGVPSVRYLNKYKFGLNYEKKP